ncbi:MAG TPA: hypothetical protein DCX22_04710 [Dehalococcoidia bacterium]|nr:hypothetical protein [Dehalococcoidia bacterium]
MGNKHCKLPFLPKSSKPKKIPDYLGYPTIENRHIAWRFSNADIFGSMSCGNLALEEHQQLWKRLRAFEKMNVDQLRATGSLHSKSIPELEREYRDRLLDLKLDDIEEIYSFRIDGACRLWCMKFENIFSILWWDKNHQVVQIARRHT